MSADFLKILPRVLRALRWTCNPKPEGAPPDTESWDSPDRSPDVARSFWVLRADACVRDWQTDIRLLALANAARFALGLKQGDMLEFGRRLGRLESAEVALEEAYEDNRACGEMRDLANGLVESAGLTLEAWLATREEAAALAKPLPVKVTIEHGDHGSGFVAYLWGKSTRIRRPLPGDVRQTIVAEWPSREAAIAGLPALLGAPIEVVERASSSATGEEAPRG